MIVDNFIKSKDGIGLSCMRFVENSHNFVMKNNVLSFFHNKNKYYITFQSSQKVCILTDNDIQFVVDSKDGLYYSYSEKKFVYKDPKDSLNNFLEHMLNFSNRKDMTKNMVFFVRYD
jgi:hypothetical protein